MERRKPEPVLSKGLSSAQWPSLSSQAKVGSHVAGAEALTVGYELAAFSFALPPLRMMPLPKAGQCCSKRGWCGHFMCIVVQAVVVWVGSEIWTARIISAMDCCPCPAQTLLWGLSLLCPYSGALPLAFATLVLVWSFTAGQAGHVSAFYMGQGTGCGWSGHKQR